MEGYYEPVLVSVDIDEKTQDIIDKLKELDDWWSKEGYKLLMIPPDLLNSKTC